MSPSQRSTQQSLGVSLLAAVAVTLSACLGGAEPAPAGTPPQAATATSEARAPAATPTPPPWPVAPVLPAVARARVVTDNLNVRVGPSTTAAAIGLLQPGDDIGIAGRSADSQWLAIAETGWTAYRAEWLQLSTDLRTLPVVEARALVPPMQPAGTSSGYPAIDVVIDAVLTQDLPRLRVQAETMRVQCQAQPGLGGPPPCTVQPGATPGTSVEVFPTATCEGEHVLAASLPTVLGRLYASGTSGSAPLRLYAVVEGPKQQSPFFPEGRWTAIFALPDGAGRSVGITEKGIVRVDFGCNAQAAELLQRRPFEPVVLVLPPVLTPPVHPRP